MAEADNADDKGAKKGGNKTIIFILLALLLGGSGTVGTLYFLGMIPSGGGKSEEVVEEVPLSKVPIYYSFEQPFTVNFETQSGLRFLQVQVELMSYDPRAIEAVQSHMPVIKNNIILMFSNQGYGDLVSREGKDKLREQTLKEIESALEKHAGRGGIEEVYFTSFVIQ